MTRWGQVQNTETTNTIHRTNRSNSALSIAPMFNLTTNLLCHKTSQQAATVQQLPSTELCLRIVWLSDGPAPRRWSPVKVSMELWARHMGRHCVVDKIVIFLGAEFPFFSDSIAVNDTSQNFTMFRDGPTLKLRHYAKQAFQHTVHVKLGQTDSPNNSILRVLLDFPKSRW